MAKKYDMMAVCVEGDSLVVFGTREVVLQNVKSSMETFFISLVEKETDYDPDAIIVSRRELAERRGEQRVKVEETRGIVWEGVYRLEAQAGSARSQEILWGVLGALGDEGWEPFAVREPYGWYLRREVDA